MAFARKACLLPKLLPRRRYAVFMERKGKKRSPSQPSQREGVYTPSLLPFGEIREGLNVFSLSLRSK
jgi:hypothetical protein